MSRILSKVRKALNFSCTILETYQHHYYLDEDDIGGVTDIWFLYRLSKEGETLKGILKHNGELQLISCQNCAYYLGTSECEYDNRFIVSERNRCTNYSKWVKKL